MAWNPVCVVFCALSVFSISTALKPRPPSVSSLTSQDFFNDYIAAECVVTGYPLPSITWVKDGEVLDITERIALKQGHINITRVTVADEGTYYCVATNTYGVSRSSAKTLTKSDLFRFPTEMPENVTGHAGKNHSLPCRSRPDSKPRPALKDFNWYLGKSEIPHSRRITVDQLGNLHFLPLTVNDSAKDNAMYNCSVFNAESRSRVYGSPTKLTVISGEKPQPRSPSLVYYTESATLNAGDWLELQCIADGLPQPEVTWIPPGGSLSNRHKVDRSLYSLSVRKVKKTDEGIYACKAKNSGGEVKQTIQVTVTEELISHIYPMMMVLPEGSTQEFQCAVNEADADIAWFINNKPVGEDKRIYEYRDTLVVNNVQKPRDTFSIQCHVTKDNRTHVSDATLTVIEPIQINASDSHVDIVPGGKGHLNVSATVDPDYKDDLKYIWHHANSELKTSNLDAGIQVYPKDGFSHLTIDTSYLKASEFSNIMGEYVCEVTVGVPHATKRLKFTVTSKKAGYTLHREPASAGMSLWWLGLVGAILLVIVLTLGIIYMQIRNKGGVYLVDKRERQAGHDPVKELAEENKMQELNRSDENDDINDYQE